MNNDSFKNIITRKDLADYLGYTYKNLIYNLFQVPNSAKYREFKIAKKSGGERLICAPASNIKYIQRILADKLLEFCHQKKCVQAFAKKKSIKTNAEFHRRSNIVVNLDLKDFFPSINFGRVRGLFLKHPFNCNELIATTLAQICCYNGKLPQGAPTSPILSNYICRRLDNELTDLAVRNKCRYTRYADDITFSTGLKTLPSEIGMIENNALILSDELKNIIVTNGFEINKSKVRYAFRNNRQEVTGLIVNKSVNVKRKYIKRVKAMLHAWQKYGLQEAAREHFEKYNYKNKHPEKPEDAFKAELIGMLSFIVYIKGKSSPVYNRLYKRLREIDPLLQLASPTKISLPKDKTVVFCEGKTDRYHIDAALKWFKAQGKFLNLDLYCFRWDDRKEFEINNDKLMNICKTRAALKEADNMEVYLFDRDDRRITKEFAEDCNYKKMSEKVYAAILPKPKHRDFDEICIEHYYDDSVFTIKDKNGRRLYTTKDFHPDSGNLIADESIYYAGNRNDLKKSYPHIIDDKVLSDGKNVAMSKFWFAKDILNKTSGFVSVTFENFEPLFDLLAYLDSLK